MTKQSSFVSYVQEQQHPGFKEAVKALVQKALPNVKKIKRELRKEMASDLQNIVTNLASQVGEEVKKDLAEKLKGGFNYNQCLQKEIVVLQRELLQFQRLCWDEMARERGERRLVSPKALLINACLQML